VLLVEKDRIVRELLEVTLARAGRVVQSATSAQAALEKAVGGATIDVALIENALPDGSGIELGNRLRAIDSTTEILLMSANPSLEAVLEAVEAGATEYFPKPFEDINQVTLRVGAAEERARLRRERKWLHQALVESEERYRKLFAATPDAVIVFDERSQLVEDANPAALALYGFEREEFLGVPVRTWRGHHASKPTAPLALATGGVQLRRDRRRDASPIEVEFVIGRFHVNGKDKIVEIIRDIGERLREQSARNELEVQLRQSQKLEALGRLAGGVAHDFNNLLAVILNYANFVTESLEQLPSNAHSTGLKEDVDQILRAATSATSLTRQLLAFSRRELVQAEVLDVNAIVRSTERLLKGTLGPNIELSSKLADDLAHVRVDRGQLEQVLVNLVVNARDAMPRGGTLTIATRNTTISTAAEQSACRAIELEVVDTGQGIDPGIIDRIFDPFFTTKDRDRGTGLGLATVKGIVEHAGGSIHVSSTLGVGTRFSIHLPVTAEVIEAKPRSTAPSRRPVCGERILVVDDDQAVRRALSRILKSAGYQVIAASSADEALDLHERSTTPIDLVVTDVLMSGLSGEELVQRLRLRQPEIKVVFATGYATMAVIETGDIKQQRAVLPKPFDQKRLLEVVAEVLNTGGTSPS
jgi:PAS domain S-box-containing protein